MSGAAAPRRCGGGKVRARLPRIALALAGGGSPGGIDEIGALLALSESLDDIFRCAHPGQPCEPAHRSTRRNLLARQEVLAPVRASHGIRLNVEGPSGKRRSIAAALNDPRPLLTRRRGVRQATRDLAHNVDYPETWLAASAAT